MADSPSETETASTPPTPAKRGRKPRVTTAASSTPAAEKTDAKPTRARKPRAAATEGTKTPAKRTASPKSTRKPAASRSTSAKARATKAAKTVRATVEEAAAPITKTRLAIGAAAVAGVAASVAAVLNRKKLVKAGNDAIDAVTGKSDDPASTPTKD